MRKNERKYLNRPLKVETLKRMISRCKWKLRKKEITEKERDKYLKAIEISKKIISKKERVRIRPGMRWR